MRLPFTSHELLHALDRTPPWGLTDKEWEDVLHVAAAEPLCYQLMLGLQYEVAMSSQRLCGLQTWFDLDLERGEVTIAYIMTTRTMTMPLSPALVSRLRTYLNVGPGVLPAQDYVFESTLATGVKQRVTPAEWSRTLKRIGTHIGKDTLNAPMIRKRRLRDLLMSDVHIDHVAYLAGYGSSYCLFGSVDMLECAV